MSDFDVGENYASGKRSERSCEGLLLLQSKFVSFHLLITIVKVKITHRNFTA